MYGKYTTKYTTTISVSKITDTIILQPKIQVLTREPGYFHKACFELPINYKMQHIYGIDSIADNKLNSVTKNLLLSALVL